MDLLVFTIKDLYGVFNHRLNFANSDIDKTMALATYVEGRNGIGKTTILKAIDSIAKGYWSYLLEIRFSKIDLEFSDSTRLEIIRKLEDTSTTSLQYNLSQNGSVIEKDSIEVLTQKWNHQHTEELIVDLLRKEEIRELPCGHWANEQNSHMRQEQVAEAYGSHLMKFEGKIFEFLNSWNVKLLGAERLIAEESNDSAQNYRKREKRDYMITHIVEDIKTRLRDAQSTMFTEQEHSRDDLEAKILSGGLDSFEAVTADQFDELYKNYEEGRKRLENASLSPEKDKAYNRDKHSSIGAIERNLIAYMIQERVNGYKKYQDILDSIELFGKLISSTLTQKEVKITLSDGLEIITQLDEKFQPENLSSGEQQIIILAHTILFSMPAKSLILIDEPELSMDVDWQTKLPKWILSVAQKRNLKFILATHAPLLTMGQKVETIREDFDLSAEI